ncbi:hypothetical protein [Escherichia coli]|uniref:hypothetical protein n=1 Tax=Escherichia coli TaxID=562 RepID=UPI000A5020A7|nr:hypothetical protein [Escherichia coli]
MTESAEKYFPAYSHLPFLPPRKDGLLKKQHPKELTDSHLNTNLACQMAGQI